MKKWVLWSSFALQIILLISFFVFIFNPYEDFVKTILSLFDLENKREMVESVLTETVYQRIKYSILLLLILSAGLSYLVLKRFKWLESAFQTVVKSLSFFPWLLSKIKTLKPAQFISLGFITLGIILHRLILSSITPVVYDEAYTYLAFTSKNPLLAAFFYPTSNNHILFTHTTQVTKILPFDILNNLRISAILANIFAITTLFFCLKKRFGYSISVSLILIFSFSFPILYYGFVARGYSLLLFFFIIGFFSTLNILEGKNIKINGYRLSISSALGMYTIPVYLYPMLSLFGFIFLHFLIQKNTDSLKKIIYYSLATGLLTLLMYLPIFTLSGISSVTSNKFVQSLSFQEVFTGFKEHIIHNLRFFTGFEFTHISFGFFLVSFIAIVLIAIKKNTNGLSLAVFCFLMAPILMFVHRVIPVERTWIYLCVPGIYLFGIILSKLKWPKTLAGSIFILLFLNHTTYDKQYKWYDGICKEDTPTGDFFANYFHQKKALIITSSRMNAYLKFNQIRNGEDWLVIEKSEDVNSNTYRIQYLRDDEPDKIEEGYVKVLEEGGYRLLKYSKL